MSTKASGFAPSARERLLAAANQLFYEEGVRGFGIKEVRIRSYMQGRHATRRARLEAKLAQHSTPAEKLLGVFDLLVEITADPTYRGCAFLRADAELLPGGAVKEMCHLSRGWLRGVLLDLVRQVGVREPQRLVQRLVLLYDGMMVAVQMDGDRTAAVEARALAAELLDAATARTVAPRTAS